MSRFQRLQLVPTHWNPLHALARRSSRHCCLLRARSVSRTSKRGICMCPSKHSIPRIPPFVLAMHSTRRFSERIDSTKDYYATLGISRFSSKREIHNAFVKLAKEWHPDVHATKSDQEKDIAKQKFQTIQEAHEILGNESMRKKYDQVRNESTIGLNQSNDQRQSRNRGRESEWDRAFRQQMAAEWEYIRTEQQVHQASHAYAHASASYSQRYPRFSSDVFGGVFNFWRSNSTPNPVSSSLSTFQIFVSLLIGITVTHFATAWFTRDKQDHRYRGHARGTTQQDLFLDNEANEEREMWNQFAEDVNETTSKTRQPQHRQIAIPLSTQHLAARMSSTTNDSDNGDFSSFSRTKIDIQTPIMDPGTVYNGEKQEIEKLE